MHFITHSDWEDKNPVLTIFDDPKNPSYRWRAVELPIADYYYHLHIAPDPNDIETVRIDLIVGDFADALNMLLSTPRSTLSLQTPEWANDDEPGLYRVIAIYKSSDPISTPYITECSNGKMYILGADVDSENLNPTTIEKIIVWTPPKKV